MERREWGKPRSTEFPGEAGGKGKEGAKATAKDSSSHLLRKEGLRGRSRNFRRKTKKQREKRWGDCVTRPDESTSKRRVFRGKCTLIGGGKDFRKEGKKEKGRRFGLTTQHDVGEGPRGREP